MTEFFLSLRLLRPAPPPCRRSSLLPATVRRFLSSFSTFPRVWVIGYHASPSPPFASHGGAAERDLATVELSGRMGRRGCWLGVRIELLRLSLQGHGSCGVVEGTWWGLRRCSRDAPDEAAAPEVTHVPPVSFSATPLPLLLSSGSHHGHSFWYARVSFTTPQIKVDSCRLLLLLLGLLAACSAT